MKKIFSLSAFILFIIYWLTTIFFVFPDNPINLKYMEQYQIFDLYLFQRWGFFAPPPTFNDRLYFTYYFEDPITKEKKIKTFEVLTPIVKEKQLKAPFNRKEEVVEYIISHSIIGIENNLKQLSDLDDLSYKDRSEYDKVKNLVKDVENTKDFKILINYARDVAISQKLQNNNVYCQVTISNIPIPQFSKKDLPNREKEKVVFASNVYNIFKK